MRKIIIVLIGVFLTGKAMAQTEDTEIKGLENVRFGLNAGYTRFNLRGSGTDAFSTGGKPVALSGWTAGAYANVKLGKVWGLRHEVSIIQKGALLKIEDKDHPAFDSKYKSLSLDIVPISVTAQAGGIQLYAGPYLAVLINSSIERMDENGQLYKDKNIYGNAKSPGNYSQKIDGGFVAGLGFELKNGLNIGGKYSYGMTPVIEHTERSDGQWKIYNRGFILTIGYTLSGKK